jgi:hypothetical protein
VLFRSDYAYYGAGKRVYGEQIFRERPNGGRWVAFGSIKNDLVELTENAQLRYSGERFYAFKDYLNAKELRMHIYGTPIGRVYPAKAERKYGMGEDDLAKLLYILHESINPGEAGFNTALLENVPYYTELGFLTKDRKAAIPVLFNDESAEFNRIADETVDRIARELTGILAEFLTGKAVPLPRRLTGVPGQKRYLKAADALPLLTVYRAAETGRLRIERPLPCAILAADK